MRKFWSEWGRLREKYPAIARYYEVTVEHEQDVASGITWTVKDEALLALRFSGSYLIRSSRTDLNAVTLWELYNTLTMVEDSFRSLKRELGLRPTHHRIDRSLEGHLFITVCAYHLLATIQCELHKHGINHRWETVRSHMSSQCRVTVSMTNREGERIHTRQTTEPEPFHQEVYRALGLPMKPIKSTKFVS